MASPIDPEDLRLLTEAAGDKRHVHITVDGAAYSCCGRGWQRRDGYEQVYAGYIDNLQLPEGANEGTFMLYSVGLGTISYVVACRFFEVLDVRDPAALSA